MSNSALKALFLALEPTDPSNVPNGTIFLDSTNGNALSQKDYAGLVSVLAVALGSNPFLRSMVAGESFGANKPLALRNDGKIVMADSDSVTRQQIIGHSNQVSLGDNSIVQVICLSTVLPGALTGLGFISGQNIYLGETTGTYTNDISTFSGDNDTYIKVGIALPPAGTSSSTATDLLIHTEVIATGTYNG